MEAEQARDSYERFMSCVVLDVFTTTSFECQVRTLSFCFIVPHFEPLQPMGLARKWAAERLEQKKGRVQRRDDNCWETGPFCNILQIICIEFVHPTRSSCTYDDDSLPLSSSLCGTCFLPITST